MAEVIQFPPETSSSVAPAEADQIITLVDSQNGLRKGGGVTYVDITPWKTVLYGKATAYVAVVVEFISTEPGTLGDGTSAEAIGLFAELPSGAKFCLGLLGMNLGGTVPQVPLMVDDAAVNIGFAQLTVDISLYDKLSVGGLFGDIAAPGETPELTVRVRPVRDRDYIG